MRGLVESAQNTFQVAAYIMFLPILIVAYRDGQLVTVFRQAIFFVGPVLLWLAFARIFNVTMAAEMRAISERWRAEPTSGSVSLQAPLSALPAAVRRRRLALAQQREQLP